MKVYTCPNCLGDGRKDISGCTMGHYWVDCGICNGHGIVDEGTYKWWVKKCQENPEYMEIKKEKFSLELWKIEKAKELDKVWNRGEYTPETISAP